MKRKVKGRIEDLDLLVWMSLERFLSHPAAAAQWLCCDGIATRHVGLDAVANHVAR